MQDKVGFFVIMAALMYCGYRIFNNWAIAEYGTVAVWAFKQSLFSAPTLVCAVVALLALYAATKFQSPKMLLAAVGVAALVPFGIWLHGYLGSKYFNIIGKTFFYGATTGISGWALFIIFTAPMAVVKRFTEANKEAIAKRRIEEAKAMAILADAKGRYRQSQFITVAGKNVFALDTETGRQKWYAAPTAMDVQESVVENRSEFEDLDAVEIFEQIYRRTLSKQNCPSFIIAGEKRSGKSTFAEYLTHRYADEAEFVVFDPKQADPLINWGPTVRLVGQNSNYAAMAAEMDRAEAEVATMSVDPIRPKRFYVFDEWINLLAAREDKFGKRVFAFMLRVLTEWSYLGIGVIIMPHATEKTALGFPPGYGGLVRNFDGAIWFDYNLFTDERKCFFEIKGQQYEIKLWNPAMAPRGGTHRPARPQNTRKGPLEAICAACASVPKVDTAKDDWRAEKPAKPRITDFFESRQDKFIIEARRAGMSNRQILDELNWPVGGTSNKKLHAVFGKYGMGTDS